MTTKDRRLYGKFTLDFPDSHKIMPLSDKAFRCLVEATLWSRKHMSDGVLPSRYAVARWGLETLQELASNDEHPSLIEDENAWIIRDYSEHQDTREEIEARSSRNKAAGQKGGQAKAKHGAKRGASEVVSESLPETETHITTSRPNSSSPDPDRIDTKRLTNTLVDALTSRGVKVPGSLKSWNTEARRLLDIDKRPLDEALRVLAWSQQDPFWSQNILSMPKFRQKYDQLRLKADDGAPPVETRGADDLMRDCWQSGDPSPIFIATGWTRPPLVWPDDSEMTEDFDRDAFRREFWRNWITENRPSIAERLRKTS